MPGPTAWGLGDRVAGDLPLETGRLGNVEGSGWPLFYLFRPSLLRSLREKLRLEPRA